MATLGELVVKVTADTAAMELGLGRLRRGLLTADEASKLPKMALLNSRFEALQRRMELSTGALNRFSAGLRNVGTTLTIGVTAPIAALGVSVFGAAADMDSLKRALTAVAGSSRGAEEQLKRLQVVALAPGLGFKEAIQGSVRLQAVGISAQQAERVLKALGNTVALTGGGKTELDRITVQLGQLSAKGKVLQQDLRPIIESGPAIAQALLKAFGTIDPERITKLGLTSSQFLDRLAAGMEQLPRVTGGARNSLDNFSDALFRARAAIGEKLLPAILPLIDGLSALLAKVETINPNTVRWGIAIAGVAAVAGPLILVISSLATAVTALAGALAIGLLPVIAIGGPILIALAALSAMWAKNKLDALAAAAAADQYRASLIGLTKGQLTTELTEARLRLSELRANEAAMRAAGTAGAPLPGTGRPATTPSPFPGTGRTSVPLSKDYNDIVNRANEAAAKVSALTQALDALNAAPVAPTPTVAPLSGGRDKLAGLMDGLQDRIREFEQLQKFAGVAAINLLPDDAQDQIRLVNSLSGELDTLNDGLDKFQQAGRTPPAGLTFGIGTLTTLLAEAEKRLDTLATLFNDPRLLGTANIRLPDMNLGEITGGINVEPRRGTGFQARGEAPLSFLDKFKDGVNGLLVQFGPMSLALAAVNAVLEPLQPLIDALLVPFQLVGEMLAIAFVPVLKILWPIIKAVAIVFSYLQEATDRIIGGILWAAGGFVKGMGKLINAITPFANPGNPLIKAGEAIQKTGEGFTDAAKEIAKRRKELEKLSFEDALDKTKEAADRLTESMLNAVSGFKAAGFRFAAMEGRTAGAVPQSSVSANVVSAAGDSIIQVAEVHLHAAPGDDIQEIWRQLKALIQRESRSKSALRSIAAQIA